MKTDLKTTIRRIVSLGILGLAFNAFPQSFLTDGLIAYYPFNGNANDQTTNANNGTAINAVLTADRNNQPANAYAFNGQNAWVSAPNQSSLTFADGGDFTIGTWASFSTLPAQFPGWFPLIAMDNGTGDRPKWILAYGSVYVPNPPAGNYVQFITSGGSGSGFGYFLACTAHNPVVGAWHHYLVTKAGSTYTVYIDGQAPAGQTNYMNDHDVLRVGVTGPSTIVPGITAPLSIGWAEGAAYMNGNLDDVRIYNRALSGGEVQQLYAYESGPRIDLLKAVTPSFGNLKLGQTYQLQISGDLNTWTNHGSPFTATNASMVCEEYFDLANWNTLFFRLQLGP